MMGDFEAIEVGAFFADFEVIALSWKSFFWDDGLVFFCDFMNIVIFLEAVVDLHYILIPAVIAVFCLIWPFFDFILFLVAVLYPS